MSTFGIARFASSRTIVVVMMAAGLAGCSADADTSDAQVGDGSDDAVQTTEQAASLGGGCEVVVTSERHTGMLNQEPEGVYSYVDTIDYTVRNTGSVDCGPVTFRLILKDAQVYPPLTIRSSSVTSGAIGPGVRKRITWRLNRSWDSPRVIPAITLTARRASDSPDWESTIDSTNLYNYFYATGQWQL
jgi:hypothetical protein